MPKEYKKHPSVIKCEIDHFQQSLEIKISSIEFDQALGLVTRIKTLLTTVGELSDGGDEITEDHEPQPQPETQTGVLAGNVERATVEEGTKELEAVREDLAKDVAEVMAEEIEKPKPKPKRKPRKKKEEAEVKTVEVPVSEAKEPEEKKAEEPVQASTEVDSQTLKKLCATPSFADCVMALIDAGFDDKQTLLQVIKSIRSDVPTFARAANLEDRIERAAGLMKLKESPTQARV